MSYDADYYATVFRAFDDPVFALRWARACALTGGYGLRRWGRVLEFGAGLGQNLAVIEAEEKWAVDVNPASQAPCQKTGAHWRDSLDQVPNDYFEMILSRHSLEHVSDPLLVLEQLRARAMPEGQLFVVIPIEALEIPMNLDAMDVHQHLFSWTPTTIRNLCIRAGWRPLSVQVLRGRGFHRSLPLIDIHPRLFLMARSLLNTLFKGDTGEIVLRCSVPA
ncbi:MAG: class I SAM-dependent methyltransferase [Alphaproteobacteria bacterium]|nr:class I SAM-dependent methyltransferase [Alphaproteobacteria bacterium]MBF0130890.1 class I SAM-dependent methyltransferase [Alphaproteobacteria bacterium]